MIYVEMHGRLGNQLFQYAAARSLQNRTNQKICISFNKVIGANTEGNVGWQNSLIDFKTKQYEIYENKKNIFSELNFFKKIICVLYAISYKPFMKNLNKWFKYQKKWCPLLDKMGIRWLANGYYNFSNDNAKDFLLNGAFEDPNYFDDIRDYLLQEITPIHKELSANEELYYKINNTNSICVSLRHFQLTGTQRNLYDVCSKEYYKKAIEIMKSKIDNPHFVFFSDDIEWINSVVDTTGLSYSIETPNNPLWEKLRLMYSCKHFVIPNSTFAWWAQYLGRNENKIVISPAKWFNDEFESPLISKKWIKIDYAGQVVE